MNKWILSNIHWIFSIKDKYKLPFLRRNRKISRFQFEVVSLPDSWMCVCSSSSPTKTTATTTTIAILFVPSLSNSARRRRRRRREGTLTTGGSLNSVPGVLLSRTSFTAEREHQAKPCRMCVRACVHVCKRERERGGGGEKANAEPFTFYTRKYCLWSGPIITPSTTRLQLHSYISVPPQPANLTSREKWPLLVLIRTLTFSFRLLAIFRPQESPPRSLIRRQPYNTSLACNARNTTRVLPSRISFSDYSTEIEKTFLQFSKAPLPSKKEKPPSTVANIQFHRLSDDSRLWIDMQQCCKSSLFI